MLTIIDGFLNKTTMYRLVLYYLAGLTLAAMVMGLFGLIPYGPLAIFLSALFFVGVCWLTNYAFARAFAAPTNVESVYITALILTLIVNPLDSLTDPYFFSTALFASVCAIGSKYIFAIGKKHIFNPAALGVALPALAVGLSAGWWVGTAAMMPFVLVGGLAGVRKIRHLDLVAGYFLVGFASIAVMYGPSVGDVGSALWRMLLHSSLLFFVFVMLTEPLTTPPQRWARILYGGIVGFLSVLPAHVGSFYFTPELALIAGNVFSYLVSPKQKLFLKLKEKVKVAENTYDYVFESARALSYRPGQYMEWTLAHAHPDNRGNRRYFTLASSPAEPDLRLGLKFYSPASTFKNALSAMKVGDSVVASQLSGEFVLPEDTKRKLAFIAGGIGVTPFRSMILDLLDRGEARDAVLLYSNKTVSEIAYRDIFDRASRELGIRTVYALTAEPSVPAWAHGGPIDARLIAESMPDYRERTFYISGPHAMVNAFKKTLRDMGVPRRHIKVDFFPGYA